jgi:prepilin-type N-terminal cleavage/methylation domain-containing protein
MMRKWHTLRPEQAGERGQRGFGLIEVMISITILTIGLLALVGTFATALASTQCSQEDLIAKQKALEALESIYTARNTQQISFAQVANISSGGIFTDGYTALLQAGPDGLVGTADDVNFANCPGGVECFQLPGPDGILGTADDTTLSLGNFNRQILISPVLQQPGNIPNPNLKQITVNVQYTKPGLKAPRVYTVNALMSAFR